MSNSGPTSAACGNIAIPSASDSSTFLPRNSSRAIAYAANIAMITEMSVAMIAMPIELISALVNSGLLKIWAKLSNVTVVGRNCGFARDDVRRRLEGQADHPQQREEAVDDDDDAGDRPPPVLLRSLVTPDLGQVGLEAP